jgi:dolichol-phosphate mannosyltransferase
MFGILFFLIGILGEYIGMIYDEVKGRPQFIVDELIGIEKND